MSQKRECWCIMGKEKSMLAERLVRKVKQDEKSLIEC